MTDLKNAVSCLKRPKLLVQAARIGAMNYRRERDLSQILSKSAPTRDALAMLVAAEDELEKTRQTGDTTYSIQRHIGVLIALVAEARLTGLVPAA